MDYNDGSAFGYDQIDPYRYAPISYDLATEMQYEKPILVARQEYKKRSIIDPKEQTDAISEVKLVKRITDPYLVNEKEGFASQRNGQNGQIGRGGKKIKMPIDSDDMQLVMLFLVIVVFVVQLKMMMNVDMIMRILFSNIKANPNQQMLLL
jgi:hypothetical protein